VKFINYTIVKLAVCVTLGTISAYFFSIDQSLIIALLCCSILFLAILWFVARNQLFQTIYFGSLAFICFFLIGFFNYQTRLPQFDDLHFSHIIFTNTSETKLVQLKILEEIKPDQYNYKFIAKVQAVKGQATSGKCLLYVPKDTTDKTPSIDEILLALGVLKEIPKPLNPNQFDYSKYMQTLGVYHEFKLSDKSIVTRQLGITTLKGLAGRLRDYLITKLQKTEITGNQRAILQALVLGEKRDITKELYQNYAAAGAVHILAVSGLHVGILFLLLSKLLSGIKRLKYGSVLHSALIVISLWGFAFVTGLSPSVTRSVTMFLFFAFASMLNRQTSTVNTLFLSYLLLLLINPLWLLHVGFQLSYLAVLSIIIIQPKLSKYYRPKFKIVRIFWDVTTVSFAAQIGLAPLTLYYFHQFPGLFFLTNLVVIPVLSILLSGGILVVLLAGFEILPNWFARSYNEIIKYLNSFIKWVADQEAFLFSEIHFSIPKLFGSYLLIISLLLLWERFSVQRFIMTLICIFILNGIYIQDKHHTAQNEFVVFHKSRKTILAYKHNGKIEIFGRDTTSKIVNTFPVKDYKTAQQIVEVSEEKLQNVLTYRDHKIVIIDSSGVYPNLSEINIVILIESPKLHLERLIDSVKPHIIIADGSNYKTYVKRWEETCKIKKLPFHYTGAKGAFIIE
tara:strand:- start:71143 stop:73176 length:2034 start_codon:yes stop_codon:yes gene_type:complete